jgi:hypothetical protein
MPLTVRLQGSGGYSFPGLHGNPIHPQTNPSDPLHNLASRCVLNCDGSYISKSDRPHADRPSQHLQLAPSPVASRGSVMSQTLHHRDLPRTRQLKKASVPGMLCLLAPYSYHVPA